MDYHLNKGYNFTNRIHYERTDSFRVDIFVCGPADISAN